MGWRKSSILLQFSVNVLYLCTDAAEVIRLRHIKVEKKTVFDLFISTRGKLYTIWAYLHYARGDCATVCPETFRMEIM